MGVQNVCLTVHYSVITVHFVKLGTIWSQLTISVTFVINKLMVVTHATIHPHAQHALTNITWTQQVELVSNV